MRTQSLIPSFEDKGLHCLDLVAADAINNLNNELEGIKTLSNPMTCESKYLPFLAYAFNVDFWDENLIEKDKRSLIKQSISLNKYKGTVWAIEKVFEALDIKANVAEWFNYSGEPYHFKVDLTLENKEISVERVNELTQYINIYKNVRSVLDEISLSYKTKAYVGVSAGIVCEATGTTEMLEGYAETIPSPEINISAAVIGCCTLTIGGE